MSKKSFVDEVAAQCLLGVARRLSRVVTGIYEEELRPFDLKPSQFNLLIIIAKARLVRRVDVGRYADLDPSTLTRNLAVMMANGWIEDVIEGDDGRGNPVCVTAKGLRLLEQTVPAWRRAQQKTSALLGEERVDSLATLFPPPTKPPPK